MSIWSDATRAARDRQTSDGTTDADTEPAGATTARLQARDATVVVAGEQVPVEEADTVQTGDGNWLTGTSKYGRPRGADALESRQIVQTSAMQAIANGIVDQLVGGDLAFANDVDTVSDAEAAVRDLTRDVLTGPHLHDKDLDDLVTAAVEDMLGPGDAYWQLLGPAEDSGVDLPVVSLQPLDALTIRHNVNEHGHPQDPPYYQAAGAFTADGIASLSAAEPVALQRADVAVMHYPKGTRSYRHYPKSPSQQVADWLEILTNSTMHHNRFYSDNEIPPGLIQVMGGNSNTVDNVKDKIQAASGDPRDVPVIGGDGGAQWIELGGTAVNLSIIEEQKWFFQLCLASLGLGKQELGFIEDVNRANGEVESSRIFKRITGPFAKQFTNAFQHIARQFDAYRGLDDPFDIELQFTDPREEHARQERMRQQYQSGMRTFNEVQSALGNDPSEIDTTVEIVDGVTVDYGDHPRPVVESLMIARRMEAMNDADQEAAEATEQAMADAFDPDEASAADSTEQRTSSR